MIEHRPDRASPWRARVRTPDGRLASKSFRRKVDAEAWEQSQRTDMRRGEWVDPRAGQITLTEWLIHVDRMKRGISEDWRKSRSSLIRCHIDPTIGLYPLNRITTETLEEWIGDLTLSPTTVRKLHGIVGEALRLAVARGRLLRNPDNSIELPAVARSEHRYLTELELLALAGAMEARYQPFIYLGGYGGLRPGENLRAEWGDLADNQLRVRGTKTKTSYRTVRLPSIVLDALARHRRTFPHVRLILHNRAGNLVDERRFRNRAFARAVNASIGEPMVPYDLRHTHVGLLIAQGMHAEAISARLGHTSIRTTMDVYGGLLPGVGDDAVDRLGYPQTRPQREWQQEGGT